MEKGTKDILRNFYLSEIIVGGVGVLITIILFFILPNKFEEYATLIQIGLIAFAGFILIIGVLYPLMLMLLKTDLRYINEAMEKYGLSEEDVYNEYITADHTNSIRVSNHFTFIKQKMQLRIIPNSNIVWIYEKCTKTNTGGKVTYSLIIKTLKKETFSINFHKKNILDNCLKDYSYHPHIVLGYSKEYEKKFKNHFKDFLDIQYNQNI